MFPFYKMGLENNGIREKADDKHTLSPYGYISYWKQLKKGNIFLEVLMFLRISITHCIDLCYKGAGH